MKGALKGLLVTGGFWVLLLLAHIGFELVRGHAPFAVFAWEPGGKYITLTVLFVLALGAGVGLSSDRIQSRTDRG